MADLVILSGKGEIPFLFKELAKGKGYRSLSVGVKGISDKGHDLYVPFLGFKEFEKLLEDLGKPPIVMLGKFEPSLIFAVLEGFLFKVRLFFGSAHFRENYKTFLRLKEETPSFLPADVVKTFIEHMEKKGFSFLPSEEIREILRPSFAEEGNLNGIDFPLEEHHLRFFEHAKRIADMDIGQTLVVKDKSVVAVEGAEGTNGTLKRACKLFGKNLVMVKVGRTEQDYRIDVPTVGMETLKILKKCRFKALLLEAGKVLIVRKEEFLKEAKRAQIAVIGLTPR